MKLKIFFMIIFSCVTGVFAQIPNNGFENWVDEIIPQEWITNNFPSIWTTVSRSPEAYSGSFSAKMEIEDFNGSPIPPVLYISFPVSEAYTSLHGYYRLHPSVSEVVLVGLVFCFKDGALSGSGVIEIEDAATVYTTFTMEINPNNVIPDSIMIQFQMLSENGTDPGSGSYALIDQLSFGQSTDVKQIGQFPMEFSLKQNYPNPFNPSTTIEYSIPEASFVQLKVFDILGKEIEILYSGQQNAGTYRVDFAGDHLSSGLYITMLQTASYSGSIKMFLLK